MVSCISSLATKRESQTSGQVIISNMLLRLDVWHDFLHVDHTVGGRNPAPVDRWLIPSPMFQFQPSKVVQDFIHSINSSKVGECGPKVTHPSSCESATSLA